MKDVMVALGQNVENFSAFEIGAINFMESKELGANPYEPGFTEYDQFNEGWAAAKDGQIAGQAHSIQCRYQTALGSQ